MKLSEMDFRGVHDAVIHSGVADPEATWIATDFLSDTYWNDPKCAGRRIRVAGGDSVRFFDYLPEINWGE